MRTPQLSLSLLLLLTFYADGLTNAQLLFATTDVEMHVIGAPTLIKSRDLNFGSVWQGMTTLTVNPVTGGNSAAFFTLTTQANSSVSISFSSTDLTSGTNSISFSGLLSGNSSPDQNTSALISSGNSLTAGPSGDFYLWAGGTANLAPDQLIGVYTGSFTITIVY